MSSSTWILAALLAPNFIGAAPAQDESEYYAVDHLTPPDGARVEAGGLGFLPDGRLVVSTRRGQVWLVENPLAPDPKDAPFELFAEGLQEGLGLTVLDGQIYVLQRGELSILRDTDGDDRCDEIETVSNGWGVSGHYHEFAFGLPRDAAGNFYISLNVSFGNPHWWHGRSTVPYRGWVMKIAPDGTATPFASGFRSPCGIGLNAEGDLFVTENQGDWMPACPLFHVEQGKFYGHPASLAWTEDYLRDKRTPSDTQMPGLPRANAACWIPYDWSRSAGEMEFDSTSGKFGPFARQLFIAELTNGLVLRAALEKVQGEYQGAVFPFRSHVGAAIRMEFAADGTLFAGLTDRGWGGQRPGDGVARIRWTGKTPMEIERVHLLQDGFEIAFTKPLEPTSGLSNAAYRITQYDYNYWWEYGSPTQRHQTLVPQAMTMSPDRTKLLVRGLALEAGKVVRVEIADVKAADGTALLHDEFAYTINQLPEGPRQDVHVAKEVEQPIERERWEEGILFLTEGDPLDAWKQQGWRSGLVELDPADSTKLAVSDFPPPAEGEVGPRREPPITNAGTSPGAVPSALVSRFELGDCEVNVDFYLPEGGNSGIYLMGKYEVQLTAPANADALAFGDLGGIYAGDDPAVWPGKAPLFNAYRGAGKWHGMSIRFRAPRFDANGKKIANAVIERVLVDDVLLQENVELPGPTKGALEGAETAVGPLMLQGDHGPVAFKDIRIRAKNVEHDDMGWERVFNGTDLQSWLVSDAGQWRVEDGQIVGSGARSHLFSPRGDYQGLEFRAKCKINDGGNSGMYFRVAFGPGWPAGYEAQVNSTYHDDPVKTGSLYNHALIKTRLIPPDTWFTQHVVCRDEPGGIRVTIRINDVTVVDYLDTELKFVSGHVGFQQHHEGSEVRYKDVEVRELR